MACTALCTLSLNGPVSAQEASVKTDATSSEQTQLPTITVKGKKVAKGSVTDTPLATQTTADEIAKKDISDVKDLGNTVDPSVTYVKSSKSVNIRGLEADRVLTTVDGIPVPYFFDNIYGFGGGADTFDFNSLSTVNVLHGSDSSRVGSGALGGALVLRTLEPEDLIGAGKSYGGMAKLGYDGSDRSFTGSAAVAKKIENTSIMFQSSYKYGHETKNTGNVDSNGSTRTKADPLTEIQRNFLFKIRQQLEGGHTIGATAERYDDDSTKDYRSNPSYGSTYSAGHLDATQNKSRDRFSLDYKYESPDEDSLIDNGAATLYWQRSQRLEGTSAIRTTNPKGFYERLMESDEKAVGMTGYLNSDFDTGSLQHSVTVGGDVSFSQTSYYLSGQDSCSVTYVAACASYQTNQAYMPDVNAYKLGVYIEDKISLGDSPVSITPGIRFDWYKYDPQNSAAWEDNSGYSGLPNGSSDSHLSPKLRAAWQVTPDVELFAQFSTAFKAPNQYQMYVNYANPTYRYRTIGNPDLKPESSYGFDVGANLGNDEFGGRITGFSTRYKNFIDTNVVYNTGYSNGETSYFNRNNVRISGVEASIHKTFPIGITLHGSVAYARGTDIDTDEVLSTVPPVKAIVGAGYDTDFWGTDISLIAAGAVDKDSTANSKPGGYGVVNLTGWFEPEKAKGMRIQGGIYNLFDKQYYDALEVKDVNNANALYSEAGRYFKISITQKF
ncbi:hemoglobin/transferrin/lactoferrin receptor protein [Agrobacterium vitis]|nr:hemoglobin/transferrin/lactoferrin receptor protein [Agrobacterium vitis]MBE1436520.1 hemoglobin/transferrin/lactoferrin receptor protein [Agrobacterium vitis]